MANKKIKLDPSQWIVDDNNMVHFRYKVITDDRNLKSATSPIYSIEIPPVVPGVFSSVVSNIASETVGETTIIKVTWTTKPQYTNIKYFVFVKTPSDTEPIYNKTITENTFSYVVDNNDTASEGEYQIYVTLPTTTKKINTFVTIFSKTLTI